MGKRKYIVFRYFIKDSKLISEYKYLFSNIKKAKRCIKECVKHFKYDEFINTKFQKQGTTILFGNNKHGYIIYEEEEDRHITFR